MTRPLSLPRALTSLALAACLALVVAQGAAAATKITISYSEKVGDELPLWIALDAGYFKQSGLDVTELYMPAQEGIPALLTGQVQMAAIGGPDTLSAAAQGAKLEYVATFSPVYTFQLWARPQYATPSALKGQKVGVSSATGSLYAATVLSLQQLGLSTSDVAITSLGSVPNVDSALLAGSVAAAASHPPSTYYFKQRGFVDLVDLAQRRIPNVNTGLVAPVSYIEANRTLVQGAVDAIVEALQREKSDKVFAEKVLAGQMGIKDQAVLDFTYDYYAKEVAPSLPTPETSELAPAKTALGIKNPKVRAVDLSTLVDQSFVRTAAAQLHIR